MYNFSAQIGTLRLSKTAKNNIEQLLKATESSAHAITSDGSYSNVRESRFKRDFLNRINGSLQEKFEAEACKRQASSWTQEHVNNYSDLPQLYNSQYMRMLKQREHLPSYKMREKIMQLINNNQVVVISGETGCGKTTQVAQFILDDYIQNERNSLCHVVCTQPRRISAISVAERVADERGERLGKSVGYQIRMEK